MPDRFRNASLSATQRRMQEAELDVDVDPADLMEAFDKCKKGPDGAVEAKALCNELTAEAGAPVFARKIESLKKQRFTRSEFERLVAAYELKMKAAEKEGRQPQPKLGSTLSMSRTMGGGSKATLDATAAKKQADDEDADGEGGGGVTDDKEPAAPKTEEDEGLSGRGRIAARIQAHQQERMKRQLGSTRDLGASTTPEAAGKEAKGAKEVEGEKKKGDEAVPRSKSRTRWGRADSGDEDALAPPPQQQPGTSPGTGLMGVLGGLFGRKGSTGGSAPGSAQPSPAPTPEKSRPPPRATDPSPGRAAEAGESPGPSSGDAGGRTRRLSLKGLTRSLSFGQGPPAPLSPNPVADKAKQQAAEPLGATEDSLAATTMASDSRLGGTISSSASTATSPQRPTTAPASTAQQQQQQKRAGGLWSRLSSPQKAAAAFREDKLQKAATTWSRRNGTMQLDASAAPFNLSDSEEEEDEEPPQQTKPPQQQQAGGKKPAVATTPTGAASPVLPPPIDTNNQGPALEFKSPMDPALSSAVQGMNHVAGMERPQLQQLLHAAQKRSISSLGNQRRNKVLMEGKMEQWSKSMGMSTWVKLHLVLYAGTKEIRLYQDCVQASWGTVPLHEKGAIALRLLEKIECPTDAKWQGRRFDLVCKSLSTDAKYPGLSIAEGHEEKVTRTARYAFRAATAQSRLLWVTLIQAILDSPAPDKPPRRSPAVMNKNASASLSTTTISSSASSAALKKLEGSTNNVVENSASNKAH